ETIKRRFADRNLQDWGKPDLILIDGGKGQLDAALKARDDRRQSISFIGLAKREEQIVIDKDRSNVRLDHEVLRRLGGYRTESDRFILVNLPHSTNLVKLLQRIRDESHRFAVSYHSSVKLKRQTSSRLEDIPGIGPATRKRLIKRFGSLRGVMSASQTDLAAEIGHAKAGLIKNKLKD
ncbi:MAG TPA: helix-hairpin-helix domain-containing protein, partial [Candidatus Saccharimonadales bacterium]|nr:helix-hairpin-helix domain-containing protein [Candidatus Saccharimonadales bacterium]